jgi:hypothetical protein
VSLAYPLTITFGLETISKRIRVTDANGQLVVLAHQRATWVKEDVRVFADDQETQPAYRLKGRDPFGLTYSIETFDGRLLGALKLAGSNALSFSPYDVVAASGEVVAHIHAADRWVSLAEQFLPAARRCCGFASCHPWVNAGSGWTRSRCARRNSMRLRCRQR